MAKNFEKFRKKIQFKDLIYEIPNQLTPTFCRNLINKYEENVHLQASGTTFIGTDVGIKQSEDINISEHAKFKEEDRIFDITLKKALWNYIDHLTTFNWEYNRLINTNYTDTGFQMQRTTPGGFYDWHHDGMGLRAMTYIFYLNDVKHKGQTEFADGTKVKPREGKFVMFPANWNYVHRGVAPKKEIKYIVTGWLYASCDPNQVTAPRPVPEII